MMNILKKIKVNNLTWYFLLVMLLCGYIKNALYIFLIVIFHEIGHIFMSILLGYEIKSIHLYPFGGITKINNHLNNQIYKDLLISIMGIVNQMVLSLFINNPLFMKYNRAIMLFNLIPIIPLDGSKILFEIYAFLLPYKKVIKYHYITSFLFIVIYIIINYKYNINNYLIIGLFIHKTIQIIKNKSIMYEKFILERLLYDIKFSKIKNKNENINNYKKDIKYYYDINGQVIPESQYLKMKSNLIDK